MKVEWSLQIDAIKGERIYYKIFDDVIFLTNGYVGCYYKKDQLKIDVSKLNEMEDGECLNPKNIINSTFNAKETNMAHFIGNSYFAIKIKSESSYVFVNQKYLKMFSGYNGIKISENPSGAVLILKFGTPYGIILPVHVGQDIVESEE